MPFISLNRYVLFVFQQTGITEYALKRDTKTENISLNIRWLKMVKKGGRVSVSDVSNCEIICTLGDCVVDGTHHELRGEVNKSTVATMVLNISVSEAMKLC